MKEYMDTIKLILFGRPEDDIDRYLDIIKDSEAWLVYYPESYQSIARDEKYIDVPKSLMKLEDLLRKGV